MSNAPTQLSVANASFVTDKLLVGGDLSPDDATADRQLEELRAVGVSHILDVRLEWSDEDFVAARRPEIRYLHHGVDDAGQRIPNAWFDVGVGFALDALEDPDAIVLAHCHMGINRGPSLGFAVLLAQGWEPIQAMNAIRAARPIAFAAYAEDALRWHAERTTKPRRDHRADLARLATWRQKSNLDVADVIRQVRSSG